MGVLRIRSKNSPKNFTRSVIIIKYTTKRRENQGMITEDYLMRQIEILARTLAKLIFGKDNTEYVIPDLQNVTETDTVFNGLLKLVDEGGINKAENILFEKIEEETSEDPCGRVYLEIAIDFYSRLNELSNKALDECGFERSEIDEGLREAAEMYGMNVML